MRAINNWVEKCFRELSRGSDTKYLYKMSAINKSIVKMSFITILTENSSAPRPLHMLLPIAMVFRSIRYASFLLSSAPLCFLSFRRTLNTQKTYNHFKPQTTTFFVVMHTFGGRTFMPLTKPCFVQPWEMREISYREVSLYLIGVIRRTWTAFSPYIISVVQLNKSYILTTSAWSKRIFVSFVTKLFN